MGLSCNQYVVRGWHFRFKWHLCVISKYGEKKRTLSPLNNFQASANIWTAFSWAKGPEIKTSQCTVLKVNPKCEPDLVLAGCSSQGNQKEDIIDLPSLCPVDVIQRFCAACYGEESTFRSFQSKRKHIPLLPDFQRVKIPPNRDLIRHITLYYSGFAENHYIARYGEPYIYIFLFIFTNNYVG